MKRCCLLLVLGLIPLVAASPALAQPTRDQYIAQADPICAQGNQAVTKLALGALGDLDRGDFKKGARKIRSAGGIFGRSVEQVAALESPVADAPLIAAWIESLRAQVPIINRWAKSIAQIQPKKRAGLRKRLNRMLNLTDQVIDASEKSYAIVDRYGFQACDEF